MDLFRVKISSWTSSFRYPNLISGYQPTLKVPPLSTVLGLINAASGSYVDFTGKKIGYYFEYEMKGTDLETIYQIEGHKTKYYPLNKAKSNVIQREFLFNCTLYIYLLDEDLVEYLRNPYYSLVLGRSSDLVTVEAIQKVELAEVKNATKIKGQIIPFNENYLPGEIQALPKYFTDSIPRNNIGTEPFSIISFDAGDTTTTLTAFADDVEGNKTVHIYMHSLNFN